MEYKQKKLDKFEKKILNFPEVVECWLMTGAKDYLIRIAVKDVEELIFNKKTYCKFGLIKF